MLNIINGKLIGLSFNSSKAQNVNKLQISDPRATTFACTTRKIPLMSQFFYVEKSLSTYLFLDLYIAI